MNTLDSQYIQLNEVGSIERTEFIKKTYKHVAGAVLAFIVLEFILLNIPGVKEASYAMVSSSTTWLLVLGGFMLVTSYADRMAMNSHDINKQYAGLGLYVLAEAIIFLPILAFATSTINGPNILWQAGIVTMALFGGLTIVVFNTGKDFSFLRSGLMIGGVIAIGLIIAGAIFGFDLGLWFSVAMVVLAAGSILYQTSNMIHKYSTDQHVAAALGLFASLMLLFWYILQIFLSRD